MTRAVGDASVLVSALIAHRDTLRARFSVRGRASASTSSSLAKAANAVLVSSDRDLLEADIADVEVLSAREFLDRLA